MKQFEIYWANLDPTLGSEIKKTRPCVIVSPDIMNKTVETVIIVPLTSTIIDWPFRLTIKSTAKVSSAACDQIRSVAKKRLSGKVGTLDEQEQNMLVAILQDVFN